MDQPRPAARLIVDVLPRAGQTAKVSGPEAAHARARRLGVGGRVVLLDGSGAEAEGAVTHAGRSFFEIRVDAVRAAPGATGAVILCVSGVRPERLDWIAEKATEFGVSGLVLVAAARSQAFRASAARAQRLARLVREAAKQCGSARWPEIIGPLELDEVLARPAAHRILLDLEGAAFPAALGGADAALLVGPEGGWTEGERTAALAAGWTPLRLPAGTLRAETAAVAGLALLFAALGRGV